MNTTPDCAVIADDVHLVDLVDDMDDLVQIVGHLAESKTLELISVNQWGRIGRDLHDGLRKIRKVAAAIMADNHAMTEAHEKALAAVRAEKEAPGSKEDLERSEALWTMLRALTEVVARQCTDAGYPPAVGFAEDAQS
jgi:hypothetical protein